MDFFADKRKVTVTYTDGSSQRETYVGALRHRFRNESTEWKENFFYNLLNNGSIEIGSARYTLIAGPRLQSTEPNRLV